MEYLGLNSMFLLLYTLFYAFLWTPNPLSLSLPHRPSFSPALSREEDTSEIAAVHHSGGRQPLPTVALPPLFLYNLSVDSPSLYTLFLPLTLPPFFFPVSLFSPVLLFVFLFPSYCVTIYGKAPFTTIMLYVPQH